MKSTFPCFRVISAALLSAAALALFSGLAGCGLVAAGTSASAVAYIEGTLETNLGTDYEKVVRATEAALKDLEFTPVSEKKDGLRAQFIARTALDKKVQIDLTKGGDQVTRIEIHIGFLGDHELSAAVLEKIKRRL